MDVDDIMAKQLKLMEKEMREKETKLRTQEKKVTHTHTHSTACYAPLSKNVFVYIDRPLGACQAHSGDPSAGEAVPAADSGGQGVS